MDDQAWATYRERVRTRASGLGALVVCPFIIAVAVSSIVAPMDRPVGDLRDNIGFRLIFYGLFIALAALGIVASVRGLLADRQDK